ncbi:MAG TPA: ABC transporter permease [Bacilli bacterium]
MNSMWTVVAFTIRNKLKAKSFKISSLVLVILVTIGLNLPYFISLLQTEKTANIGMTDTNSALADSLRQYFESQKKPGLKIVLFADLGSTDANEEAFKKAIEEKKISGYLLAGAPDQSGFPEMTYKSEGTLEIGTMTKLETALQQVKTEWVVKELHLSQADLTKISAPVTLNKVQISVGGVGGVGKEGKSQAQVIMATGLLYALIILLFIGVMVSGQLIATEITAEKSSRVMEILVTSVTPLKQMFGKIFGMFVVSILQIMLLVAAALINANLPQNRAAFADLHIDWSNIDYNLIIYAILFYLTGYFLYATLFAAVGSIVSRTEDLSQAILPVTFLSMIGYFIAIFGLQDPTSMFVKVTSFIPFFSPFIMFLRMGLTDVAVWQVWLTIGILLASILFFGWVSAKIYRTGVLMYGKRPSWKELRKAMKAYKV